MKTCKLILLFLLILVSNASAAEITKVYKNVDKICTAEIYCDDISELENPCMILASYKGDSMQKIDISHFEKSDFTNNRAEISANDFPLNDDETLKIFIWDSISNQIPLTDGSIPEFTYENGHVDGDISEWTVSPDGKTIYTYLGNDTDVNIPNYINSKHITTIGSGTPTSSDYSTANIFAGKSVESVAIPENIEIINHCAFFEALTSQEQLILPESVTSIGTLAFYNCTGFSGNLILPENVYRLGQYCFSKCDFDGSLEIKSKLLTTIPDYSFSGCSNLSAITLPENLTEIGNSAFNKCLSLSGNLILPEKLNKIGNFAFSECSKLNGDLIIPDSVTHIGCYAFQLCNGFKGQLRLSDNLELVGDGAFNHCTGFKGDTLTIPSSLKIVGGNYLTETNSGYGSHVFYDFGYYKEYLMSETGMYFKTDDGVLFSADGTRLVAYPNRKADEVYEIPEGVTQLDELSFNRTSYLKTLVLPDSYILHYDIPKNVLNHDGHTLAVALYQFTSVQNIEVHDTNPNYSAENGILYNKDKTVLLYIPNKNTTENIVISESVTEIADGAVYSANKTNLAWKSLTIGKNVKTIGKNTLDTLNRYPEIVTISEDNTYYTKNEKGNIIKL